MTVSNPTPFWPVPSLIRSLSRAGWGDLGGHALKGVRATLRAVVDHVSDKSGIGSATAWQLAHAAGQSEKWTRRCLGVLESMGLIEWTRGGIIDGRPQPSWFKIVKRALVDLIHAARPRSREAHAQQAAKTRARIADLPAGVTIFRKENRKQNRRSNHAELSAILHPPKGGYSTGAKAPGRGSDKYRQRIDNYYKKRRLEREYEDMRAEARIRAIVDPLIANGMDVAQAHIYALRERLGSGRHD